MKNYKTKSTLFGYKIGLNNDNLYCAVPEKYFTNGESVEIQVVEGRDVTISKIVTSEEKEQEVTFKDKFKPDQDYKVYYFKVKEF